MKFNKLEQGQVFKNYIELCEFLGEKQKTGKSRQLQLKDWERYFVSHKDGQKIIIDSVYSVPLEKEDKRKITTPQNARKHQVTYYKYIDLALLQSIVDKCENINSEYIVSARKLLNHIFLPNYFGATNSIYLEAELVAPQENCESIKFKPTMFARDFANIYYSKLLNSFNKSLERLSAQGYFNFYRAVEMYSIDTSISSNSSSELITDIEDLACYEYAQKETDIHFGEDYKKNNFVRIQSRRQYYDYLLKILQGKVPIEELSCPYPPLISNGRFKDLKGLANVIVFTNINKELIMSNCDVTQEVKTKDFISIMIDSFYQSKAFNQEYNYFIKVNMNDIYSCFSYNDISSLDISLLGTGSRIKSFNNRAENMMLLNQYINNFCQTSFKRFVIESLFNLTLLTTEQEVNDYLLSLKNSLKNLDELQEKSEVVVNSIFNCFLNMIFTRVV